MQIYFSFILSLKQSRKNEKEKKKFIVLGRFDPRTFILYKKGLIRQVDGHFTNKSSQTCTVHNDYRVLTILVFRSVTNTLLYLFHNALVLNDSSALPGYFRRTINYVNYGSEICNINILGDRF